MTSAGQQKTDKIDLKRDILGLSDIDKSIKPKKVTVVSASRTARDLDDLPLRTIVITQEEILRNNYFTLADVLKNVAGVKVSQPGSSREGETFLMRGVIGNYYTKILLDNVPIAPSVTGSSIITFNLPVRQAAAIEVTFGPAASIYGADAAAGVINIITRRPETRFFGGGDVSIGSNGFRYFNFLAGGRLGMDNNILNYSIYGTKGEYADLNTYSTKDKVYEPLQYDRIRNMPAPWNNNIKIGELNSEYFKQSGISEEDFINEFYMPNYVGSLDNTTHDKVPMSGDQIGLNLNYGAFSFSYHYSKSTIFSSIGRTPFLFRYNNPQNHRVFYDNIFSVNYEKKKEEWLFQTQVSYKYFRRDNITNTGVHYNRDVTNLYTYSASDDIVAEQLAVYSPSKSLEILAGLSYTFSGGLPTTNELWIPFETDLYKPFGNGDFPEDELFGNFGINPYQQQNIGLFTQAYYSYKWLNVIAGIRYDHNSMFGDNVNPRLAVLTKPTKKIGIRASYGHAFKAPAPTLIYESIAFPAYDREGEVEYAYVPNTKLQPEHFSSIELGMKYKMSKKFIFDLNVFFSTHKNQIFRTFDNIDLEKYPNAFVSSDRLVRKNTNTENSLSELFGVSLIVKAKNLVPPLKLNIDFGFNYHIGNEILPEESNPVSIHRQISPFSGQLGVDFQAAKNIYIRLENVFMSSWYRRNITSMEQVDDPFNRIDGYYTLDALAKGKLNRFVSLFFQMKNVFDSQYGGIDATGTDVDLKYNPQMRRNWRIGMNINLNQ